MNKFYLLLFISAIGFFTEVEARPQYSMLTGNRCISCHVTPQGSALRNELGVYSKNDASLFNFKGTAVADIIETMNDYNSFFDNKIRWGLDYRLQSAKLGGPESSKRETFTMQATPYLLIEPMKGLQLYGQYNFSPVHYPSQSLYNAFVAIQPFNYLPQLKVGLIKPAIGNQYDDHTLLIRQVASPARALPILTPDYSEWGAEFSYDAIKTLNLTLGVYKSHNLSKNVMSDYFMLNSNGNRFALADKNSTAGLLRMAYMPRFWDNMINTNIGGSYYLVDDFSISNAFLHIGLTDYISLISEYVNSSKKDKRITDSYMIELLYHVFDPFDLSVRYEKATSEYFYPNVESKAYDTEQYVLGANIYLLPFIELRPEYRIYDRANADSYSAQWTFQLHIYY